MIKKEYNRFLVRLSPKIRELLDIAHVDLEMTRAQIINAALKEYLKRYNNTDINTRLDRLAK